jgi:hypothetical protein
MNAIQAIETAQGWRDLVIEGDADRINRILDQVDRTLPPNWKRNPEAEKRYVALGGSLPASRCYAKRLGDYDVRLWLLRVSDRRLQGGLVEPTGGDRYYEDAAEAIAEFLREAIEPAVAECGGAMTSNRIGVRSDVTRPVVEKLWAFHEASPRIWPPPPPAEVPWREFVIAAFQNRAAFEPGEFRGWLRKLGWEAGDADALINRFFADAALLSEYDDRRQTA